MQKYKILIIGAFPPPESKIFGGIVTSCQSLLDSSFSRQFDLILVDSTQISNPPPGVTLRSLLALRRLVIYLYRLIDGKPQAVVLFASLGASVAEKGIMAWISKAFCIPVFLFPRGGKLITIVTESKFHRFWISASMRGATHFLCQGPVWQRFATDVLRFPIERTSIIPNWTASNSLLAIGERRIEKNVGTVPQLLFLGWLERDKGIFELLEACDALSSLYSFRLVIAGRGHAEPEARAFVERNCLNGVVEFVGWVRGTELEALFLASDILVLPSWAEGLPNAMIEAMAAKLAVVVSAVGNVPDVITDGEQALLIPPREVAPLRDAVEKLLIDKCFCRAIAERGHQFARHNFAVEPAVAELCKVIDDAINENIRSTAH